MLKLSPKILEHEGRKAFAVIPYDEFIVLQDILSDYEDLKELRTAKREEKSASTSPLAVVREELSI